MLIIPAGPFVLELLCDNDSRKLRCAYSQRMAA